MNSQAVDVGKMVAVFEARLHEIKNLSDDEREVITLFEMVKFMRVLSPELANGPLLDPAVRVVDHLMKRKGNHSDFSVEMMMALTCAAIDLLQTDMGDDKAMEIDEARHRIVDKACPKKAGILRPVKTSGAGNSGNQGCVDYHAIKRWQNSQMTGDRLGALRAMKSRLQMKCSNHAEVVSYLKHAWDRTVPLRDAAQRESDIKEKAKAEREHEADAKARAELGR